MDRQAERIFINPIILSVLELQESLAGAKCAHHTKLALSAYFLHSMRNKTYKATLGTQEPTPLGSWSLDLMIL